MYKKLLEQAQKKAAAAKAILEGESPNVEEANRLLAEAQALRERAQAMKAADDLETEAGDAIKAFDKLAKEPPTDPGGLQVMEDETDRKSKDPKLAPYKSLGEQLMDLYQAGPSCSNPTPRLLKAHRETAKAISGASELVPVDGGIYVQHDFAGELVKPDMTTPILDRVRQITISANANGTELLGVDETSRAEGSRWGGIRGYHLAEADQFTASKPKFRRITLGLHKVGVFAYATDEILQDAAQLETVIGRAAREELRFMAEDDIINGTGSGMPYGILASSNAALVAVTIETGQAADTIVAENVIKMRNRRYKRGRYVWLIGQDVEPQLLQMSLPVGTGGALVYMPPGGLSGAPYGNIFGDPVIETEYSAALGDQGDILLVDLSQYLFCSKGDVQSAQSIHVRFEYGEQCFRFLWRYDGQPSWHNTMTPYKATGNTVSPYVTLAERA